MPSQASTRNDAAATSKIKPEQNQACIKKKAKQNLSAFHQQSRSKERQSRKENEIEKKNRNPPAWSRTVRGQEQWWDKLKTEILQPQPQWEAKIGPEGPNREEFPLCR